MDAAGSDKAIHKKRARQKRGEYYRISLKNKIILFSKVIHHKASPLEIAKELGIKYSTAKTLIRNYKPLPEEQDTQLVRNLVDEFDTKSKPLQRCSYQLLETGVAFSSSQSKEDSGNNKTEWEVPEIKIISSILNWQQK